MTAALCALTPEIKRQIFGLTAAKLFGVDAKAKRQEIEHDKFSQWRKDYLKHPHPFNTQYEWVWKEDVGPPTIPIEGSHKTTG